MKTDNYDKNINNTGVYKKQEFETYLKWKSLPVFLRNKPREVLQKMGINDPEVFALLEIKSQTEFAQEYGIRDLGTLTDWNKKIEKDGLMEGIYG